MYRQLTQRDSADYCGATPAALSPKSRTMHAAAAVAAASVARILEDMLFHDTRNAAVANLHVLVLTILSHDAAVFYTCCRLLQDKASMPFQATIL